MGSEPRHKNPLLSLSLALLVTCQATLNQGHSSRTLKAPLFGVGDGLAVNVVSYPQHPQRVNRAQGYRVCMALASFSKWYWVLTQDLAHVR